jgi:hypothetical protein
MEGEVKFTLRKEGAEHGDLLIGDVYGIGFWEFEGMIDEAWGRSGLPLGELIRRERSGGCDTDAVIRCVSCDVREDFYRFSVTTFLE